MSTVPFFIADIWQGLLKGHGLVNLESGLLRLEIQVVDSLTGLLKVKHLVHEASLDEVASVSMHSRLGGLYNVLSLQGARMDVFAGFPRARGGRCRLRIARRDRHNCAALVAQFALAKSASRRVPLPPDGLRMDSSCNSRWVTEQLDAAYGQPIQVDPALASAQLKGLDDEAR